MPETANSESVLLMIGEVRGQIRELVHSLGDMRQIINGVYQKLDNVAVTQATLESLKQQFAAGEIETAGKIAALEIRLTAVEKLENQRAGALKLSEIALKIVPWAAFGSFFAIALAITEKALTGG